MTLNVVASTIRKEPRLLSVLSLKLGECHKRAKARLIHRKHKYGPQNNAEDWHYPTRPGNIWFSHFWIFWLSSRSRLWPLKRPFALYQVFILLFCVTNKHWLKPWKTGTGCYLDVCVHTVYTFEEGHRPESSGRVGNKHVNQSEPDLDGVM